MTEIRKLKFIKFHQYLARKHNLKIDLSLYTNMNLLKNRDVGVPTRMVDCTQKPLYFINWRFFLYGIVKVNRKKFVRQHISTTQYDLYNETGTLL